MSSPPLESPRQNQTERRVKGVFEALRDEYMIVGRTHVRGWHLAFLIGISAGVVSGAVIVANESGRFSIGRAATPPTLTVIAPNGGELWEVGKTYSIQWCGNGKFKTGESIVTLAKRDGTHTQALTRIAGIAKCAGSPNSYPWTVALGTPLGSDYEIQVAYQEKSSGKIAASDVSDQPFSVTAPLAITAAGSTSLPFGQSFDITFSATNVPGALNPPYAWAITNGALPPGLTFAPVTPPGCDPNLCAPPPPCPPDPYPCDAPPPCPDPAVCPNPGPGNTATLTGEPPDTGTYPLELTVTDGLAQTGKATFTLSITPAITVLTPNGNETWSVAATHLNQ